MRLDAWLKQPHAPAERLRLIERLAQALNTVHDRGETLAAITPEHVEVGSDLKVDFGPAAKGRVEPGYSAPERLEGGPPSTAADIYSVGCLCWEILVGRPCGEAPSPLADIAPELPGELANSVMGCLERSPEWRPKDLTYLAQLAAAQQKVARAPEPKAERTERAERTAAPARASAAPRPTQRRASRSQLPLLLAALLLVAAAASSYLWLHRQQAEPAVTAGLAAPPPAPPPTAPSDAVATATPPPVALSAPAPAQSVAEVKPTPAAVVAAAEPPRPAPVAASVATPTPAPTPTPTPTPAAAPPPPRVASAPAVEPSSLSAVSPLSVRRPGKVLLDIRGDGLRSDQVVRILPLKETPRGITVLRQKWVSANLVSVLLDLDAKVTPTVYAIALEDANGTLTNPLRLNVTK